MEAKGHLDPLVIFHQAPATTLPPSAFDALPSSGPTGKQGGAPPAEGIGQATPGAVGVEIRRKYRTPKIPSASCHRKDHPTRTPHFQKSWTPKIVMLLSRNFIEAVNRVLISLRPIHPNICNSCVVARRWHEVESSAEYFAVETVCSENLTACDPERPHIPLCYFSAALRAGGSSRGSSSSPISGNALPAIPCKSP